MPPGARTPRNESWLLRSGRAVARLSVVSEEADGRGSLPPEVWREALRREKARPGVAPERLVATAHLTERCHYCARQVGAKALTMDHIVPLIRGGAPCAKTVPACRDCIEEAIAPPVGVGGVRIPRRSRTPDAGLAA
jgi:hypothetical protein